jgi:hypothetical protein
MKIEGIIWLRDIVDKLASKHQVEPYEVEEVLDRRPQVRFVERENGRMRMCILPWAELRPGGT